MGLAMELLAREHQTHLSDVAVGVDRLCYTHCCTVYRPISKTLLDVPNCALSLREMKREKGPEERREQIEHSFRIKGKRPTADNLILLDTYIETNRIRGRKRVTLEIYRRDFSI